MAGRERLPMQRGLVFLNFWKQFPALWLLRRYRAGAAACQCAGQHFCQYPRAAPQGEPEASRPAFARLAELAAQHGLEKLSMGTSQDWEVAVEEGATILRLGTVLYR